MRLLLTRGLAIAAAALLCRMRRSRCRRRTDAASVLDGGRGVDGRSRRLRNCLTISAKIRHVSTAAEPARPTTALETLETRDADLPRPCCRLSAAPSRQPHIVPWPSAIDSAACSTRRTATTTRRSGWKRATPLAYEGLARVWRDWGCRDWRSAMPPRRLLCAGIGCCPQHARHHAAGARPGQEARVAYERASRSIREPPMRSTICATCRSSTATQTGAIDACRKRSVTRPDARPPHATTWRSHTPRAGAWIWPGWSSSTRATPAGASTTSASSTWRPRVSQAAVAAFDGASRARSAAGNRSREGQPGTLATSGSPAGQIER